MPRPPARAASICVARAPGVLAGVTGAVPARVRQHPGRAASGDRTCTLTAPHGLRVIIDVNTDPQVYFVLERTIVENAQLKSFQPSHPSPVEVRHVGLDAAWFPDADYLLTTDGVRLVKVAVEWPRTSERRRIRIGRALAPVFLGRLHPKAADPNGG